MSKEIQFMQGYAKWLEEARQEIYNIYGKEYADLNEIRFNEDGKLYSKHYINVAGARIPSTIKKTVYNKKVTPWKDSKHYVEV
jgi:hypothetical protein